MATKANVGSPTKPTHRPDNQLSGARPEGQRPHLQKISYPKSLPELQYRHGVLVSREDRPGEHLQDHVQLHQRSRSRSMDSDVIKNKLLNKEKTSEKRPEGKRGGKLRSRSELGVKSKRKKVKNHSKKNLAKRKSSSTEALAKSLHEESINSYSRLMVTDMVGNSMLPSGGSQVLSEQAMGTRKQAQTKDQVRALGRQSWRGSEEKTRHSQSESQEARDTNHKKSHRDKAKSDQGREVVERAKADRRLGSRLNRERGEETQSLGERHLPAEYHSDIQDVPRRPAAVDRLERRLFPSLASSTRTLLQSTENALSALTSNMQSVKEQNAFIFNGTRYSIMLGVRRQLQDIANTNQMVYEAVLRASLLTKDIYLRAHQNRLTGPTTRSLANPEISLPSLQEVKQAAHDEERLAQQMLHTVQDAQRRRQSLGTRLQQVKEGSQNNFARNDLRTLIYYINSTSQKLNSELVYSTQAAYIKRNSKIVYGSRDSLRVARDLLYKADNNLATAVQDYRGNYRVVQDWKYNLRDDGHGLGPPVSRRRRQSSYTTISNSPSSPTAEERLRLLGLIQRLKSHATDQERRAREIERLLPPVIRQGQMIIQQKSFASSTLLSVLTKRLDKDGKKLFSLLDSIRVLIGGRQQLRWSSAKQACTEDENDDVEGSGCETYGSGEGLEKKDNSWKLTVATTDDEDFVFVDEKESTTTQPSSLVQFGRQLSTYVDRVKLKGTSTLQRANQLRETTIRKCESI